MARRHLPEVLVIEQASFEYAWTEDDFRGRLRCRNCIGMVVEVEDKVNGYMVYELHEKRIHVLNFVVHPNARHCGIGTMMVTKLISKLSSHRRQKITLALRESNLIAQVFFRNRGFKATRILRNYYEDSGEDAFYMEYCLGVEFDDEALVNRIAQYYQEE